MFSASYQPRIFNAGFVFLLFLISAVHSRAQDNSAAGLLTNIEGRHITNLNGNWQVIIDPYEAGYYDYRYQIRRDGYFKNQKPENKSDLIEYDFDRSGQLLVPGDWNTQNQDLFFYEGTVWYKKSFDYSVRSAKRVFVYQEKNSTLAFLGKPQSLKTNSPNAF